MSTCAKLAIRAESLPLAGFYCCAYYGSTCDMELEMPVLKIPCTLEDFSECPFTKLNGDLIRENRDKIRTRILLWLISKDKVLMKPIRNLDLTPIPPARYSYGA